VVSGATIHVLRHRHSMLRQVAEWLASTQAVEADLEQRVDERTRELTALLDISESVNSTLELGPLLGVILDELGNVVEYSGAAVLLQQDAELAFLEYRGPLPREQVMALRLSLSEAPGYQVLLERRAPVIIDDIWGDSEESRIFHGASQRLLATFGSTRAWLGLPLIVRGALIGMLRLDHSQPGHFSAQDAWLAQTIANQAAVAIENARLYARARELAVLQERQRLARELHDSVSQALYGIALGTQTARELVAEESTDGELRQSLAEPLEYVSGLAEAGLAEMRALLFELRPESLASEGLVAGLQKQVASLRARHRLEVAAELGDEPDVPLEVKEMAYRITQEALQNVVRHARAKGVALILMDKADGLVVEVRDDGIGFDPTLAHPGHLGLQTMRERAERVGGSFKLVSGRGEGTTVHVRLPRG
jgi:signal transduction histidine kinase